MLVPASIAVPAKAFARPALSRLNKQNGTSARPAKVALFLFCFVPSLQRRNRRNSEPGVWAARERSRRSRNVNMDKVVKQEQGSCFLWNFFAPFFVKKGEAPGELFGISLLLSL
ncbi:hypothetical protein [uncultured Subdoligranulum sp.]|uniref:hypothetical protein n=1 Tax=uncultured Subdoligranulum sp. TaxID=512298 RepID=UPI0025F115C6|nr:hypothetical protein [uncultured Subdoligranulum sp.]